MKKYFKLKNILIALLIVFVVMQVVRIDTKNPATNPSEVLSEANMTPEVKNLLSVACYDCHSNNTRYPWYSNIAPVSWWLQNHVREGREELNFSEWNSMDARKKDHKLKECVEMIEEGEMPINSYTWTHADAQLTAEQQAVLIRFFNSMRDHSSDKAGEDEKHESHE
jgi:hypothetical protein